MEEHKGAGDVSVGQAQYRVRATSQQLPQVQRREGAARDRREWTERGGSE